MAEVKIHLTAMGIEKCNGCERTFNRGEQMSGVEASDGSPMGWFCPECIDDWTKNGEKSRVFALYLCCLLCRWALVSF